MTERERTCSKCGRRKPIEAFARERGRRNGRRAQCRECRNELGRKRRADPVIRAREEEYEREHRADPAYRERVRERKREWYRKRFADPDFRERERERNRERRADGRAYLDALKRERGCADCGAHPADHATLHFHHLDPATKAARVSILIARPRAVIDREIAKCELLCARCHRKRHAQESRS